MTLADFISSTKTSRSAFAAAIGVSNVSVTRYLQGARIPSKDEMLRIAEVTKGAVTPNDFYGVVPRRSRARAHTHEAQ
jgi:3,4-dihydroxy 2-butanone 4-phosphate synthase/GTP cyclohydrolase II